MGYVNRLVLYPQTQEKTMANITVNCPQLAPNPNSAGQERQVLAIFDQLSSQEAEVFLIERTTFHHILRNTLKLWDVPAFYASICLAQTIEANTNSSVAQFLER